MTGAVPAPEPRCSPAAAWRRWSDPAALVLVLAVALGMRLAFVGADPPIFLTTDSLTYALPAQHLATGQGFDLSLRRTPGYPLLLGTLWSLFGVSFQPVVYLQHLLGVATAGLTWLLGRISINRVVALLGGLLVALSGPQIIYEHYAMTEALFTFELIASLVALAMALQHGRTRRWVVVGLLFGLCALTRPIGQIFPLLAPLAVLLQGGGRAAVRPAGRAAVLVAIGFAVIVLPWMGRNQLVGGELTGSAALGKTLFGRITRHDDGLRFDLPPAGRPETDPLRARARAVARQAAQDDTSRGSLVHERLIREFGYTEAQAYNVMRDVALEVLLAQPLYYLQSSLRGTVELFRGQEEPLRLHLQRLAVDRLRRDWQQRPELAGLLPPPVPPEVRWLRLERASWLVRLWEPSSDQVAPALGLLFLVGTAALWLRPGWRRARPLPLLVIGVLLLSAFLDGPVPRFRYPLDPAIGLLASAGLVALVQLGRRMLAGRRVALGRRARTLESR